jgi:hypothetical protein
LIAQVSSTPLTDAPSRKHATIIAFFYCACRYADCQGHLSTPKKEEPVTCVVVFTARADIIEQFRFLVDRSPAATDLWYTGAAKAIAKLDKLPERHPIA